MAIKDSYPIKKLPITKGYIFVSIGNQGRIVKVVLYQYSNNNFYNLAFGDWINGDVNDSIVSNNNDLQKVISTVAKTIYQFTEEYPLAIIKIQGVDSKRTKLYNTIFRRRFFEIKENFSVKGIVNGKREDYNPSKSYEKFEVKRKIL